tara:strand:- start:140 stop:457 length:318 start_codon:yes stop_codon:yes gene_type:complete
MSITDNNICIYIFRVCLDIGCGTGQATEALTGIFHHVVGVDSSESQLETARKRAEEVMLRKPNASHTPGDKRECDIDNYANVYAYQFVDMDLCIRVYVFFSLIWM